MPVQAGRAHAGEAGLGDLAIAFGVGLAVAAYVLAITSLPARWTFAFIFVGLGFLAAALLLGSVRKVLLVALLLDIPFRLDIELGYAAEAGEQGALAGWLVSVTTIALVGLYALRLVEAAPGRAREAPQGRARACLPGVAYVAAVAVSALTAYSVRLTIYELFLLLQMLLLYTYLVTAVRSRGEVRFVLAVLVFGLLLEAVVMIGIQSWGGGFELGGLKFVSAEGRVGGTVGHPNVAAGYLGLVLAPTLSVLAMPVGRGWRAVAASAWAAGLIALLLTGSRGGLAAFLVSHLLLLWFIRRRGWVSGKVLVGIAVVAALLGAGLSRDVASRLREQQAAYSRVTLAWVALRMIGEHPVAGVGGNNSPVLMERYVPRELSDEWLARIHNKYLLVLAETGPLGLLTFLWLLLATLRHGWRAARGGDPVLAPLACGFSAATAGIMLHMLVDAFSSNTRPVLQILWVTAGLTAAIALIGREKAGATEQAAEKATGASACSGAPYASSRWG